LGLGSERSLVEEGRAERPLRGRPELAVLLCNEALFPRLAGLRRSAETAAIAVLGTDAWFPSAQASQQQIAFASFRAIEQRLWLVRAAEGGGSAVIDPFGRVVQELPFGRAGFLRAEIAPQSPPALGERATLAGLLTAGAVTGFTAASLFHRRRSP
jgi:apolipoprotein N-acyltransferase